MTQELASALTDVRRAYRLLWAYQKRVLHSVAFIRDRLGYTRHWVDPGFAFPSDNIESIWTWCSLPLALFGFEAAKPNGVDGREAGTDKLVKAGDRLLYIHVVSDSGLWEAGEKCDWKREPDPSGFDPVEKSRSELRMFVLESRRDQDASNAWHKGIVKKLPVWPDHGKLIENDALGVGVYCEHVDFAEIGDQDALAAWVDAFEKAANLALAKAPVAP